MVLEKILSIVTFLGAAGLMLGFLIFVHELGHFLAARLVGIRVEVFSIGFGKRLFGLRRGATDYRISMIPFGGYVRMAGEELPGQGEGDSDPEVLRKLSEEYAQPGDTLEEKSVPARLLVAFAGAGMNGVIAILFTIGLAYFGINVESYLVQAPVIAYVQTDSVAEAAGFQAGDRLLTIGDSSVNTWEEAQQELLTTLNQSIRVTVDRNGQQISGEMTIADDEALYFGGIGAPSKVIVGTINADSPADRAGLEQLDTIVSVNDTPLGGIYQLTDILARTQDQEITLGVKRKESMLTLQLTPEFKEEYNRYMIGIGFAADPDKVLRRYPLGEAITKGFQLNVQMCRLMVTIFHRLIMGKESISNLGGPVMIVDMAGKAAKSGIRDLIWLTALISLNLAVLNLMPFPIFDGGMIVFLLIEAIIRRPVNEKIQILLQNVFFILLICFAFYITYKDIQRINISDWFK